MNFKGSGNIYTYNYMYSNASAICKNINMTMYGKDLAIITFSSFMLESYFNHVCQFIYDIEDRVNNALDTLSHEDYDGIIQLKLKNISFNEQVAVYKGFIKEFDTLKKILTESINSRKKKEIFKNEFVCSISGDKSFDEFDSEYRFSPRVKCKAILKSLNISDYNSLYQIVDFLFKVRDSLAHGRTHKVNGTTGIDDLLTCDWQEFSSPENSQLYFEQSKKFINIVDTRIDSEVPLGCLQDQFGAIIICSDQT